MKLLFPLLAVALAFLSAATVRADDAAARIRASVDALTNAKAYRRTTVTTDLDNNKARTLVAESVQPGLFHMDDYILEGFTDGKIVTVRNRHDGTLSTADAALTKYVEYVRAKVALKGLLDGLKDARVEIRTTFRDLPTTVVAFTMDQNGMVSTGKLWISDADHLPLKIESETHGETKLPSGEAKKIDQRNMGSYEYGPSIKIVMP